jgi:hypothetical protein
MDRVRAADQVRRWQLIVLGGMAAVGILLLLQWPRSASYALAIAQRVCNPSDYGAFISNFVGLFSGSSVLEFIPGSIASGGQGDLHRAIYDVPMAIVLVVSLWGAFRRSKGQASASDRCLAIGWSACVIGFFAVAGPRAIQPHWERYGVWLVAPTVLLASRGAFWWVDRIGTWHKAAAWLAVAAGWLLLAGFFADYFVYFAHIGGRSHVAFRTAQLEPKSAALRFILEQQRAGSHVAIVADDWWMYWPLAYLAADKPGVEVAACGVTGARNDVPEEKTEIWRVRFIEGPAAARSSSTPSTILPKGESVRRIIPDESGTPLLEISR